MVYEFRRAFHKHDVGTGLDVNEGQLAAGLLLASEVYLVAVVGLRFQVCIVGIRISCACLVVLEEGFGLLLLDLVDLVLG